MIKSDCHHRFPLTPALPRREREYEELAGTMIKVLRRKSLPLIRKSGWFRLVRVGLDELIIRIRHEATRTGG